jgi:hypothetical protein
MELQADALDIRTEPTREVQLSAHDAVSTIRRSARRSARRSSGAVISLAVVAALIAACVSSEPALRAPLIGITSVYLPGQGGEPARAGVFMTYVEAVQSAGAVPVVLPPLNDEEALVAYLERLDGLVLVGGRDIPPDAYGEEPTAAVVPMPRERWDFESRLLRGWLLTDKPVLGICLGSQFANVVQGGTLIQDISTEVGSEIWMGDVSLRRATDDGSLEIHGRSDLRRCLRSWLQLSPFAGVRRKGP